MAKCERCRKEHDGSYGSGRFCSKKCAKSFATSKNREEINRKVSAKLKNCAAKNKKPRKKCVICRKTCSAGNVTGYCKVHIYKSSAYKKAHSIGCSKNGGYRRRAGRGMGGYYKSAWFDSQFEIEVAKYMDEKKIKWERNTKRFYFRWKMKQTYYIPDFYLPTYDLYLETKGYWRRGKKRKTLYAVKSHKIKWLLLMQKAWKADNKLLLEKLS